MHLFIKKTNRENKINETTTPTTSRVYTIVLHVPTKSGPEFTVSYFTHDMIRTWLKGSAA